MLFGNLLTRVGNGIEEQQIPEEAEQEYNRYDGNSLHQWNPPLLNDERDALLKKLKNFSPSPEPTGKTEPKTLLGHDC